MNPSLFFYDLETSGVNPKTARIMQFAGQRTDMDLNPIGEPYNFLVRLSDDVLPEPDAILITGITPQMTIAEGLTEAEFFKIFCEEIALPATTFIGFNNVRFDDEFMRYGLYRNFYDPYTWQWKNDCSKWDLLDVVRMTRALRPEGVQWPFASDGKPTNRLELLTGLNGLDHENAHDALNDVHATIAVARLIREKQPKLFDYLYKIRLKKEVEKIVQSNKLFVYTSGKFDAEFEKTTVVCNLGTRPDKQGDLVYDLRVDPAEFINLGPEQLANRWKYEREPTEPRLPIKTLKYNRCPAIAPTGVLTDENKQMLRIDLDEFTIRKERLEAAPQFVDNLHKALAILESSRTQSAMFPDENNVDAELYDDFIPQADARLSESVHTLPPAEFGPLAGQFSDKRLKALLPLYKARNYPKSLTPDEQVSWEKYKSQKLASALPKYLERLGELSGREGLTKNQHYILEELQLYAESVLPADL